MPDKRIIMHNPDRHPQYMRHQTKGEPVGWCRHNKHRGKLSVRQMKQHKCLAKECPFFVKNKKHQHWVDRERMKQVKKAKKNKEIVSTICEKCAYMYHLDGKTVRYCGYNDAGKIKHYYCSSRNTNNRCSHFIDPEADYKVNKQITRKGENTNGLET